MGESAKRKQENPRNANLAAWYSFDPSNIWWLMDGEKHPQSRAPSAGLKKLSCCFRFIWQSARGKQVFTMLNCCQHLVSLPNLILDELCRHPGVLSSSERPGHRRGCHLYEHPPVMTAHHQHLSDTDGSAYYVYRRPVHQEYWPNMCPSCPKPTWMVLSQRLGLTRTLASWAWTHKGMRSEGVESHFQWIHPQERAGVYVPPRNLRFSDWRGTIKPTEVLTAFGLRVGRWTRGMATPWAAAACAAATQQMRRERRWGTSSHVKKWEG